MVYRSDCHYFDIFNTLILNLYLFFHEKLDKNSQYKILCEIILKMYMQPGGLYIAGTNIVFAVQMFASYM